MQNYKWFRIQGVDVMREMGTCQNCGRELNSQGDQEACIECCDHPEIRGRENSLLIARCEVCGVKVDEDGDTHPDELKGYSEGK